MNLKRVLSIPLFILFLTISTIVAVNRKAVLSLLGLASLPQGSLALPSTFTASLNQPFVLPLSLSTDNNQIRGVDILIDFDPQKLQLTEVAPLAQSTTTLKTFLPLTASNNFDEGRVITVANQTGKINFSAVTALFNSQTITNPYNGTTILARLKFIPKQIGSAAIQIESQTNNTRDSNIVRNSNPPQDILNSLTNTVVTVQNPQATPTPFVSPTPSPSLTPTRPPAPTVTITPPPPNATTTPTPIPGNTTSKTWQINASGDDVNEDGTSPLSQQVYGPSKEKIFIGNGLPDHSFTGLRFRNVDIPKGARIDSATISVYSSGGWIAISYEIFGDLTNNSPTFTDANPPSARPRTIAKSSHSSNVKWDPDTWINLGNVTAQAQEIVSSPNWAQGKAMTFILKGTGTKWGRKFVPSFDGNPNQGPKLTITYTNP